MNKQELLHVAVPAPSTPLNLKPNVFYVPRVPDEDYVAFNVIEVAPEVFELRGYDETGEPTMVHHGHLLQVFQKLALRLRMDLSLDRR